MSASTLPRTHRCCHPTCPTMIGHTKLCCPDHWYSLPDSLRHEVLSTYRARARDPRPHYAAIREVLTHFREQGKLLVNITASDPDSEGRTFISWWTHPDHRRQGLATREVSAFLAKRSGEVWALVRPWNAASVALAERCGFALVAADEENLTYRWVRAS